MQRDAAAERRRAVRRIARQHHPDLGGDPEKYLEAIAALEREADSLPGTTPVQVRRAGALRRAARRLRRRLRAWHAERRRNQRARVDDRLGGGRSGSGAAPAAGSAARRRRIGRRRARPPSRRAR